jgi:uncharacterized membrane protein YphA (DoxX/SURF4 family)
MTATGVGVFVLRAWIGLNLVFSHGLDKAREPELFLTSAGVRALPMPEVLGWIVLVTQLGGGVLLTLGLFTRTSATLILVTLLGAAFAVPSADFWMSKELALTYAALALLFVLHGPGSPSVDGWLAHRRKKRSPW